MVLLRSLLLAATATLSVAHPLEDLFARAAPSTGQELTLKKTKNDGDKGTWVEDGDVKFKVGDKLGEGSKGIVFGIDCAGDGGCEDLGPSVLKFYTDKGVVAEDRAALAKVEELKAVGTIDSEEFTLMVQWTGTKFTDLPKYQELMGNTEENKDAINELVDKAVEKIVETAKAYVKDHHIYHEDITNENVLLTADGDDIQSAALIDWDLSSFPPDGEWNDDIEEDFLEGIDSQVKASFTDKYHVDD